MPVHTVLPSWSLCFFLSEADETSNKDVIFSLYTTAVNHFSIWLLHAIKSWIYTYNYWRWLAQWLDWEAPNRFPNPNLHQKSSCPLFGGLLPIWSTAAFWIQAKPLHLRSVLSKLIWCTKICSTCSQHCSTKWAQFFPMTMPDRKSHNPHFKSWMNWSTKFCLIHRIHLISHHSATTSSSISTTFSRENASVTSRRQKVLSKSWLKSKAWICMLQE